MPTVPIGTRANVITGQAKLWIAPAGTAMPADTLAAGADWLTPWVHPGFTEEGVTLNVNRNTQDINVEEQSTPVAVLTTSSTMSVELVLAEDTVENMKIAYGGGTITTVAAATSVMGKKTLNLSDTLDQLAVGFEGTNSFGFFRRVYLPTVLSVGNVQTRYRRAAAERQYAVQLRYVDDPAAVVIVDKTANALP